MRHCPCLAGPRYLESNPRGESLSSHNSSEARRTGRENVFKGRPALSADRGALFGTSLPAARRRPDASISMRSPGNPATRFRKSRLSPQPFLRQYCSGTQPVSLKATMGTRTISPCCGVSSTRQYRPTGTECVVFRTSRPEQNRAASAAPIRTINAAVRRISE